MGLSWSDIMHSLEDPTTLPPAHARHLLAELEARPFTKAMLLGEDLQPDRVIVGVDELRMATGQPTKLLPLREADFSDQEIEECFRQYSQRRQELMNLLRAAIERNEALRISG
jgi:hypothetical protein